MPKRLRGTGCRRRPTGSGTQQPPAPTPAILSSGVVWCISSEHHLLGKDFCWVRAGRLHKGRQTTVTHPLGGPKWRLCLPPAPVGDINMCPCVMPAAESSMLLWLSATHPTVLKHRPWQLLAVAASQWPLTLAGSRNRCDSSQPIISSYINQQQQHSCMTTGPLGAAGSQQHQQHQLVTGLPRRLIPLLCGKQQQQQHLATSTASHAADMPGSKPLSLPGSSSADVTNHNRCVFLVYRLSLHVHRHHLLRQQPHVYAYIQSFIRHI